MNALVTHMVAGALLLAAWLVAVSAGETYAQKGDATGGLALSAGLILCAFILQVLA